MKESFKALGKAVDILKYSLEKCGKIGIKAEYSLEELDVFENLTSRFARAADIYTQKIMKGIALILREETNTYIDKANLFEKLEIADAEDLKLMRDLRNEIAHEYKLKDITELFQPVVEYSGKLLKVVEKTEIFARNQKLV
ncbi:MAG: hypothetical protein Q7R35_03855 [Elusimicrobiota bacterium]|nr:hypothetical protein [Elusimicrobiota bacterium]